MSKQLHGKNISGQNLSFLLMIRLQDDISQLASSNKITETSIEHFLCCLIMLNQISPVTDYIWAILFLTTFRHSNYGNQRPHYFYKTQLNKWFVLNVCHWFQYHWPNKQQATLKYHKFILFTAAVVYRELKHPLDVYTRYM